MDGWMDMIDDGWMDGRVTETVDGRADDKVQCGWMHRAGKSALQGE